MEIQIRKKEFKKALAFFMAVLMLFSSLPLSGAMAVDSNGAKSVNVTDGNVTSGNVALSGQCGDNVYFTLDDEGCLKIYGEGDMYNYRYNAPWDEYRDSIKSVIISDGVTSIGSYAFYCCEHLKTVVMPDTITYIGDGAFQWCDTLENITLPDSVITLGNRIFASDSIQEISIGKGVKFIGENLIEYSFLGFETVNYSGTMAEWNEIEIDPVNYNLLNATIICTDGIINNGKVTDGNVTDGNVTNGNINGGFAADYEIKSGETIDLSKRAYKTTYLKFVPEISGSYRFYSSSNGYTSVRLYDADKNEIRVYNDGDYWGDFDGTHDFTAGEKYYWEVEYEQDFAFDDDVARFSVTIEKVCEHENIETFDEVEPTCTEVGYTYGEQCVDCGEWLWGHRIIPATHIDENSDRICDRCENIALNESGSCGGYYEDETDDWIDGVKYDFYADGTLEIYGRGEIEESAFYDDLSVKHLIIKEGITAIGYSAFEYCENIEDVSIANTVTKIYSDAFYCCTGIEEITLPESVSYVESRAFYWCSGMDIITIENPECYIYPSSQTIHSNAVICGYEGSTAETYAEEYGRHFIPFGVEITSIVYTPVKPFEFIDKLSMTEMENPDDEMGYMLGYNVRFSSGDKIEVEFSDGRKETYLAGSSSTSTRFVSEEGESFYASLTTDQRDDNVWEVGLHYAALSCLGETVDVPVLIKEGPIKEVSATYKYSFYKDYDCKIGDYFSRDIYGDKYGNLNEEYIICKIKFRDGSEFTGNLDEVYKETGYYIEYSITLDSVGENIGQINIVGFYGDFIINVEESLNVDNLPDSICIAHGARVIKGEPLNLQLLEFADNGYEHEVKALNVPDGVYIDADGKLTGTFNYNTKRGMSLEFEVRWKDSPAHNTYSINIYSVNREDIVEIPADAELIDYDKEVEVIGSETDVKWFKFLAINNNFNLVSDSFWAGAYGEEKTGSVSIFTEDGLPVDSYGKGYGSAFHAKRGEMYYVRVTGTDAFTISTGMWLPEWNSSADSSETLGEELYATNIEKTFEGDTNTKWNVYKYINRFDNDSNGGFSWECYGTMRRVISSVDIHLETINANINKEVLYSISYKYDPNNKEECEKIGASTTQLTLKDQLKEGEKEYRFDNVYYLVPEIGDIVLTEEKLIYVPVGYYIDGLHVVKCTEHNDKVIEKENVVEATCTTDGSYTEVVYCPVCDIELSREDKIITSGDHNYEATVTEPTCTSGGFTTYTCECGDSYVSDEVNALDHDYELAESKKATCEEDGYNLYVCKNDNSHSYTETITSSGHSWSAWTTIREATLLESGEKVRICSGCFENETEVLAQLEGETTSDALMGVTVEYTGDAYDGKKMQLLVAEDVYAADYFAKDYNKVVAWDIKTLVDGSEVQPDVPVLVSLTIPADFDRNSIAVYHVNSATGFTEEITPVIVEGNTVKFLADSFSTYIIVDESSEISITEKMNIKFAKLFKLFTILLPDVLDLLVKLLMML